MRLWKSKPVVNLSFPDKLRVPTVNPLLLFEVEVRAMYIVGSADHFNRDSFVRNRITEDLREICARWGADQATMAEDAANSHFGKPADCQHGYFRGLVARTIVSTSGDAAIEVGRLRSDQIRIERLRNLKAALYSDPALLVVDYLDRNAGFEIDGSKIDSIRRLADELRHSEQWWAPLMRAWSELAGQTTSSEGTEVSMRILLHAIRQLDKSLAERHNLPKG